MISIKSTTKYLITITIFHIARGQQSAELEAIRSVSSSLNQFALNLLTQVSDAAGNDVNLAISPYTVWSLLSIVSEGARGDTATQLENVLNIPPDPYKDQFRRSYRSLTKYLTQFSDGTELDLSSAIFTNREQILNRTFQTLVKNFYGVDVMPTNFADVNQAVNSINTYLAEKTHNRITNFITPEDVVKAELLLTSTLFFKGQWTVPFMENETRTDHFLDERGNWLGDVQMMQQLGPFPYTMLPNIKGHALELSYGKNGRISMILILPRKNEPLIKVLRELSILRLEGLLDAIYRAQEDFADEDVEVLLPKFTINSDLILNEVLHKMGVRDVFNSMKADLLGIFPSNYLFLSRVLQQAKIEVNEEGTVASSVSGGSFSYKSPPPKFYANKPFAYLIVDKQTQSIIFAGKVSNPNGICSECSSKK